MLLLINKEDKLKFKDIYVQHRSMNATMQILFEHIRLLSMKHTVMDRPTYKQYYLKICTDVSIETPPMDMFIPNEDGTIGINRLVPEWDRVKIRVNKEDILERFPITHPVSIYIKDNQDGYETVVDDALIHWATFKFTEEIERMNLSTHMNATELIEYICGHDTIMGIDDVILKPAMKRHMTKTDFIGFFGGKNKINEEKINKNGIMDDICFAPNLIMCKDFYSQKKSKGMEYEKNFERIGLEPFDPENLLLRMCSHTTLKSDRYIILGVYLSLMYAIPDIMNLHKLDIVPPSVQYITEVLQHV